MDRALKERTIGAIVLVLVAVLIVPVFLDGPTSDTEVVSQAVVLPGQNDQPRRQQTIVLQRDRDQPVPVPLESTPQDDRDEVEPPAAEALAANADDSAVVSDAGSPNLPEIPVPEPASVASVPAAAAPEPVAERAPAEAQPKAEAPRSDGLWAVQLGSFSSRDNAERLAASLRDDGYAAFLSKLDAGSGELHRVRVGPQENRDAAEKVAGALAGAGHKGQVVTHP